MPNNNTGMAPFSFVWETTQSLPDQEYTAYLLKTTNQLWKACPPILLIVGTLGNGMSVVVLSRKAMRKSNAAIYMIVLAVMDTLVLYTGLLRQWLRYYFDFDVREYGPVSCKIHTWLVYASLDMSVWVLVALTFERLVSVFLPHAVRRYCTSTTSFVSLSVIAVLLLAINSHFLYGLGDVIIEKDNITIVETCTFIDEFQHFGTRVWPWIDLCLYSLIPMSIIVVSNVAIVVKVLLSRRSSRRIRPTAAVRFQVNGRLTGPTSTRKLSSMTAMLVTINMMLLVTTVPISTYLIIEPYILGDDASYKSKRTVAEMLLGWAAVNLLQYTSNSVNFFLYCLSGSRFREELRSMIRRGRRMSPGTFTNNRLRDIQLKNFRLASFTPRAQEADTSQTTRTLATILSTTKSSGSLQQQQPPHSWPGLEERHQRQRLRRDTHSLRHRPLSVDDLELGESPRAPGAVPVLNEPAQQLSEPAQQLSESAQQHHSPSLSHLQLEGDADNDKAKAPPAACQEQDGGHAG